MTILLDRRPDGTIALSIDGDLQFDSADEAIYHELLALPALALTERRTSGPLHALICGGGDGLAARELLKSARLARLDLVDYDPQVLGLARTDFADLNGGSLDHQITRVTVDDAWAFVERAIGRSLRYDLIVVDLTAPQDTDGARFHSIDWYRQLHRLLGACGVLAVNGASPSGAPLAYWSIYNSMRAAGLHPRPYRIALPSFAARGYGDDWGFVLASPQPIGHTELDDELALAGPRQVLQHPAQLRRLFQFPAAVAAVRGMALPTRAGSALLLHYLSNGQELDGTDSAAWDGLGFSEDAAPLLAPDDGRRLLPPELRQVLAVPPGQEDAILKRVLALMPALHHTQTREMIAAFLETPERFLATVDLWGLVERLLRRASELPRRLVAELRLLRQRLATLGGNHAALLHMGMRIVTIVTLVVILSNLVHPDTLYGKGGDGSSGGHAYTGETVNLARPSHGSYDATLPPSTATGSGFRDSSFGHSMASDETGQLYPPRRYRYYPHFYGSGGHRNYAAAPTPSEPPLEEDGFYQLTPEADLLPSGRLAIRVSDAGYLLIDNEQATLIDARSGLPLLYLDRDPALVWRVAREIDRQQRGLAQSARAKEAWINWVSWLQFAPWSTADQRELANLQATATQLTEGLKLLGPVPERVESPTPPVPGAQELFSGVWLMPDGKQLALELVNRRVFLDAKGWYLDQAQTQPFDEPYPEQFRTFVIGELERLVTGQEATLHRLQAARQLAQSDVDLFRRDKGEYDTIARFEGPSSRVEYGTEEITLAEAQRRTQVDLDRAERLLSQIQRQIDELPRIVELSRQVRDALASRSA